MKLRIGVFSSNVARSSIKRLLTFLRNRCPQRYIHYAFAHGHSLFRFVFILTLLMAKYFKFSRIIDGCFYSHIILFVVQFDRIFINPMTNTYTVIEIREACHDGIMRTAIRTDRLWSKVDQGNARHGYSFRLYVRVAKEHP